MRKNDLKISIIIVNYKSQRDLFDCIRSIESSGLKVSYEVIVVDNDEEKTIDDELLRRFSNVSYIKSPGNIGFGPGNNLGAKKASGDFLFFLNPDTIIYPNTIDILVALIANHEDIGVVAPLLLTKNGKPFDLQGSMELTPISAIFALTFMNKYFPNNPISKQYFLRDWNKKTVQEVAVVPGSAFIIRKDVFEKAGRFDENIFLFFEEEDLCRRIKKLDYKLYINPHAKVLHKWGRDKQETREMKKIFSQSRFYYFRKHFGLLSAIIVHAVTSL